VIGGDHSVAVGTWSGVARQAGAPIGLLWIDAHLDSHTLETSYSGAIHGMPLTFLLGRGDRRLLELGLPGGQLVPAHTVVFGARSFEPEEAEFLASMQVRVIGQAEIEQRGFQAAFEAALAIVVGGLRCFARPGCARPCDGTRRRQPGTAWPRRGRGAVQSASVGARTALLGNRRIQPGPGPPWADCPADRRADRGSPALGRQTSACSPRHIV
jgi:hypothetical protein